ncbi:MAG TPA: hypothetical protein VMC61_02755 [Methanocella sp.]|nr:hypothetical protein [Methanocella sp.]
MPAETTTKPSRPSVEAEFSNLVKNIDLYIRQKTDLYIQHYVLDPLDFILRQIIYLSVVASLLVVGTLSITVGIVLFVSTLISIWAALLLCGMASLVLAVGLAYFMFTRKLILKTPTAAETA